MNRNTLLAERRHVEKRSVAMRAFRIVIALIVGCASAWLAYEFWLMWQQASQNSASPGAIVLPLLSCAMALLSIGSLLRAVWLLRLSAKART